MTDETDTRFDADKVAVEDNDPAPGEFTGYCNHYYSLTVLLAAREERLHNLLAGAPLYNGETRLSDIDAIIAYYREAQEAQQQTNETLENMRETERIILMIMRHFEIPPETILTGEIPGEVEYKIWANDNDTVYIKKTKDLAPEAEAANIIVVKLSAPAPGKTAQRKGRGK